MDRTALSKRIGGLADVFASGSPIRRELEAMSFALDHMKDEKFASILNEGYEADDKEARLIVPTTPQQKPTYAVGERARQQVGQPDVPVFEPRDPKAALEKLLSDPQISEIIKKNPQLSMAMKEAGVELEADIEVPQGNAWSREASDAVIRNLISDVLGREAMEKTICCDTGRKLEKVQMPDATKKQTKPVTLTEEQTPKLSEALDSGIYEKSKGAVRKEAAEETSEKPAPVEEPKAEEVPVAKQKAEERGEKKVDKAREQATEKAEDTAEALKDLEKMTAKKASSEESDMIMFDGIELTAPMDEVALTENDVRTLGKLFQ